MIFEYPPSSTSDCARILAEHCAYRDRVYRELLTSVGIEPPLDPDAVVRLAIKVATGSR